jgi:hypothetical protein
MRNWTIFRKIEGYENYEVSIHGDVRNTKFDRVLKNIPDKDGYPVVWLSEDGSKKNCKVHRLVAEAFIPNKKKLPQINHKDEDKTNNHISNLEWCTCAYNCNYGTRIARRSATIKRNNRLARA